MSADEENDDEFFDLRDAIFDARSVDDLRKRVASVSEFWGKRGTGTAAAGLARFLDRLVFDEPPMQAIVVELRATLTRIADSDPEASRVLHALCE